MEIEARSETVHLDEHLENEHAQEHEFGVDYWSVVERSHEQLCVGKKFGLKRPLT